MYKFSISTKEVIGYKYYNNELFTCKKKNDLFKNDEFIIKEIDANSLTVKENTLMFLSDSDYVTYFYKNKIEKVNSASWLNTLSKNTILLYQYINELFTISLYSLIDDSINLIKEKIDLWNLYRNADLLYFYDKSKVNIKSLSLLTLEYLWEANLSGRKHIINNEKYETKLIEILGVYENYLLVWLEGDRLISIDTNNGNILYEILPFEGLLDVNGFQLWDFKNLFLEQETGKIIMLNKLFYYEIEIKTQKVDVLKSFYTGNAYGLGRLPNMPEPPTDITFKKAVYTKDYIYFMGGYTFATNIVGVFNRKTYNIDWQESINLTETDKFNNLKDIQYADNKIYVLDTEGTLRIFEKQLSK